MFNVKRLLPVIFIFFIISTSGHAEELSSAASINSAHYGIFTILPPLVAIILAFVTKNVIISLFLGIFLGSFMLMFIENGIILSFAKGFLYITEIVLGSLADSGNAAIILQVLTIGALIALITRMGGIHGIAEAVSKLAKTPRTAQFSTWLLGLCIFFDDYANTLTVGPMMRPVTDRMLVSREKLSFIVDATAAPTAGMALISTWVAYEVGLIKNALDGIGVDFNAYGVFVSSLPFRFYNLLIFAFILATIYFLREFGSMYKAEYRARTTGEVVRPGSVMQELVEADTENSSAWYAVFPVLTLIVAALIGFYVNGRSAVLAAGDPVLVQTMQHFSFASIQAAFGESDAAKVLFQAALTALALTLIIGVGKKKFTITQGLETAVAGIKTMNITAVILLLAWSLSSIVKELGTAHYLVVHLSNTVPYWLMPAMIFVLGSVISFATGTSYGTMGILMPLTVPVAWAIIPSYEYLIMNVGAVLTGAIFGDHCSPISDTTILASMGAGCELLDHVKTQLGYAVTVGIAATATFIMAGFQVSVWLVLPVGIAITVAIVRFAGKKLPEPPNI